MRKIIKKSEIEAFDRLYRRHFCNGLTGFKSPVLVGTQSKSKLMNLAIFSNVFHVGANPAMIGLIGRPSSIRRDTIGNIETTGYYTLNHIPRSKYQTAHLTSAKYPAEISEFEAQHFDHEFIDQFWAPFVKESPLQIGLSLDKMIPIEANDTWLIIGKVELVQVEKTNILATGHPDFAAMDTLASTGLDSYYSANFIDRLPYAKYREVDKGKKIV